MVTVASSDRSLVGGSLCRGSQVIGTCRGFFSDHAAGRTVQRKTERPSLGCRDVLSQEGVCEGSEDLYATF